MDTAIAQVGNVDSMVERVGSQLQERSPAGIDLFMGSLPAVVHTAKYLSEGQFYGQHSAQVMVSHILTAMELGVPLGVVVKNVYRFKSSVGMMGALQLGLAIPRGITVQHLVQTDDEYKGVMRRPGWVDMNLHFDVERAVTSRLLREHDGQYKAASGKAGDVWDHWRYRMLMWKAINDGLVIMGADYFGLHHIRDMETVRMMETEAMPADTGSDDLASFVETGEVPEGKEEIDVEVHAGAVALDVLVKQVEADDPGFLSFDDRTKIGEACADGDPEAIEHWTDSIRNRLETSNE